MEMTRSLGPGRPHLLGSEEGRRDLRLDELPADAWARLCQALSACIPNLYAGTKKGQILESEAMQDDHDGCRDNHGAVALAIACKQRHCALA